LLPCAREWVSRPHGDRVSQELRPFPSFPSPLHSEFRMNESHALAPAVRGPMGPPDAAVLAVLAHRHAVLAAPAFSVPWARRGWLCWCLLREPHRRLLDLRLNIGEVPTAQGHQAFMAGQGGFERVTHRALCQWGLRCWCLHWLA